MIGFTLLRALYLGCLVLTCLVGFRWGGRSERAGTAIVLAASLLTVGVESSTIFNWQQERTGLVVVDALTLSAFLCLALRSRRFWPLWATAFHLIALTSHFLIFTGTHRVIQAYALLQGFWAYPIMGCIIIGTWLHAKGRGTTPQ